MIDGIETAILVESDVRDWMLDFDEDVLINTAMNWMISGSAEPVTQDQAIERDPLWDKNVRFVRRLIQYNIDKLRDGH